MLNRAALLVLVIACSAPPPAPVATGNRASTIAPRVTAADPLGSLALVTSPDAAVRYVPTSRDARVVDPANRIAPHTSVRVVSAGAGAGQFTAGAPTTLPFGCDGNQLDVTPLVGPTSLSPGLAWILPPTATWQPAPLAITAGKATPIARRYTAGPLHLDLARTAPLTGTTTITVEGIEVTRRPFERHLMEGAAASMATLDLAEDGPGIPALVAAWAVTPSGPYLVVLHTPSWEGLALEALLVDANGATPIDAMALYLYQCAF